MDITIRIDAPRRGFRRLALFAGLPVALLALTAAVAHATLNPDPNTWAASGKAVSASSLASNLTALDGRLSKLETKPTITVGGHQYSTSATYCGLTATSYDGSTIGGYAGAKSKCEAACGTPTAHMCNSSEAVRSAQLSAPIAGTGSPPGGGWVATGATSNDGSTGSWNDCQGFGTNATQVFGSVWTNDAAGGGYVAGYQCNLTQPIACCD